MTPADIPAAPSKVIGEGRTSRHGIWLAAVLFILWAYAYLDRNILTLLVPSLKASMGLSDVQMGLLQGLAFSFVFVVAGYPIGRLADQYNRRMILFLGISGWALVTTATGFAESFGALFLARMLSGIGEACLVPASVALLSDYFAPEKRGRVMGLLLGGASLGIAGSTLLGGVLLDRFSEGRPAFLHGFEPWQLTYLAVGIPGFLVALLLFTVKEPPRRARAKAEPLESLKSLMAGRWMVLIALLCAFGLSLLAAFGSGAWLATLLMREFDVRPGHVGIALGIVHLLVGGLGPVIGGWISDTCARFWPRYGRLGFVAAVFAAQVATALMFLVLRDYAATIAINSLSILFFTFLAASGLALIPEAVPNRATGRSMALYQVVAGIVGAGLGPLAIAMTTQYVFRDEALVRESIATVLVVTSLLGLVAIRVAAHGWAKLPKETA